MSELVTEDDLVRARLDPAFRQKFMADNLERLLNALNDARRGSNGDPLRTRQIREGVDMAVRLAEILNSNNILEHPPGGRQDGTRAA